MKSSIQNSSEFLVIDGLYWIILCFQSLFSLSLGFSKFLKGNGWRYSWMTVSIVKDYQPWTSVLTNFLTNECFLITAWFLFSKSHCSVENFMQIICYPVQEQQNTYLRYRGKTLSIFYPLLLRVTATWQLFQFHNQTFRLLYAECYLYVSNRYAAST